MEKTITLTTAIEKLGKEFGKKRYRSVTVQMTDYGNGDKKTEWSVYLHSGHLGSGQTFDEAIKDLRNIVKSPKTKIQDVEIRGEL